MKSERQAQYIPKADLYAPIKNYQTAPQIGLFQAFRNSDKSNQVLNRFTYSKSVVRQVLNCKHMARAIRAHETTMVAIEILEIMGDNPDYFVRAARAAENIAQTVNKAIT